MLHHFSTAGTTKGWDRVQYQISTAQVLQKQVKETPFGLQLDIVHPASKQGKQVQRDNTFVSAGLNHETRSSSPQPTALSSHNYTRTTTRGIMLKTTTTETNSTLTTAD